MEQSRSKTVGEDSEKEMLFLTAIGSSIINTIKVVLLSIQLLGQSIVKMLGTKVTLTPQLKSSLEMEEWLPLSIGTTSQSSEPEELIPLVDCDVMSCMASDDESSFCMQEADKMYIMPLGLPPLPVCDKHIELMEGLNLQEILQMVVDVMTEKEGLEYLKEIIENDGEFGEDE